MKQQALSNFDLTWLPLTGLVIFCVCFAAYTWWTLRPSNRQHFEDAAKVPFNDPRTHHE